MTSTIFGFPVTLSLEVQPDTVIVVSDAFTITDDGRLEVDLSRVSAIIGLHRQLEDLAR